MLPGVLTHQSSGVSPGVLPSLYETKLLNKTVFGLKPSTDLRNVSFQFGLSAFWKNRRWISCVNNATEQTLCYRSTNPLIISSAHLYQWLRVTSGSGSALISVPSAPLSWFFLLIISRFYQPATGHLAVLLQRKGRCTSNHVRIKLLTRVWQVGEAVPLKCKVDISGSNNDGAPPPHPLSLLQVNAGLNFVRD